MVLLFSIIELRIDSDPPQILPEVSKVCSS